MRGRFDEELEELHRQMVVMGALCEQAIGAAIGGIQTGDGKLAERARELEHEIDVKESEIESFCLRLLIQQHPVARDLRDISSALKMITDMERIGDQAADIAELTNYCGLQESAHKTRLQEMAHATSQMVTDSVDAFVKKDLSLAERVIQEDDGVDSLFLEMKNAIIKLISENPREGEAAVDLLMIAKYLERIGDHATNLAEWVVFAITGSHVDKGEDI